LTGGIAVSESEYMTTTSLEKITIDTGADEVVKQGQ
jgi:hypothetical protein